MAELVPTCREIGFAYSATEIRIILKVVKGREKMYQKWS